GGARSIALLGVHMVNVHAAGARALMEGAMECAAQADHVESAPILIAVTHLSSASGAALIEQNGIAGSVEQAVLRYAQLAQASGLAGVVASPLEVAGIKAACGADFLTVIPGIRPSWAAAGDQSRVAPPQDDIAMGADYLVIGRP